MTVSTRLNIIMNVLEDIRERLTDGMFDEEGELETRFHGLQLEMIGWALAPPSESERASLTRRAFALHLDVLAGGRKAEASSRG